MIQCRASERQYEGQSGTVPVPPAVATNHLNSLNQTCYDLVLLTILRLATEKR